MIRKSLPTLFIEIEEARAILRSGVNDHYDPAWPRQKKAMQKVFSFLESLSDAILSGAVSEVEAKRTFGAAVLSFWPSAFVMLAPPNQADEWWVPLPKLAELYKRWRPSDPARDK